MDDNTSNLKSSFVGHILLLGEFKAFRSAHSEFFLCASPFSLSLSLSLSLSGRGVAVAFSLLFYPPPLPSNSPLSFKMFSEGCCSNSSPSSLLSFFGVESVAFSPPSSGFWENDVAPNPEEEKGGFLKCRRSK